MQTLSQTIRRTRQKCEPCFDEDTKQNAQRCYKQVCQKAQQKCQKQKQAQACQRKEQCGKHQQGKPIRVAPQQVQFGCKTDIDIHNQCVQGKKKQQCDIVKVVSKHQQQQRRTSSGGIGWW